MKKVIPDFDDFEDSGAQFDYKTYYLEQIERKNFNSVDKWIYLGSDIVDSSFVKVGLTMGNLTTRSYSSSRPTYYIFCAFKCLPHVSEQELTDIERDVLSRIDDYHRNSDGTSKRMFHYDSGRISECFHPVDFMRFFVDLHQLIYNSYRSRFVCKAYDDGSGLAVGEFVDCIFNRDVNIYHYLPRIVQWY